MITDDELGEFLRSRRGRLSPKAAGVEPHGSVRRVAGLKREEVARLAGVSVDYYARLEQGRAVRFSVSVLTAVGRALQLNPVDQAHLNDLAAARDARRTPQRSGVPPVLPAYERLVRSLPHQPVFVTDWRHNVLLANPLALALYLDMGTQDPLERNFARFVFADPAARDLFADWENTAVTVAGSLRRATARHDDSDLTDLIDDCRRTADFDRLWAAYPLTEQAYSRKLHAHPVVGHMWIVCDNLQSVGDSDQLLTVGSVDPGSTSDEALRRLAVLSGAMATP